MMRRIATWTLAGLVSMSAFAGDATALQELTADQIVEKNVAARGGLEAWRKVQSMAWFGHIESANAPVPSMPFSLEMMRPNKTRFELLVQNQAAVRTFDGAQGWKLRQASNGTPEVQPYAASEVNYARSEQGIGGPLMDYAAKGIALKLEGVDEIEGRKAYRLALRFPSGIVQHVWIDAQTFLEIKYERESYSRLGQSAKVATFYRNYQTIEGLQMPMIIESYAGVSKASDKLVIAKVLLNPPLDDQVFAKPVMPGRSGAGRNGSASADGVASRPTSGFSGQRRSAHMGPLRPDSQPAPSTGERP